MLPKMDMSVPESPIQEFYRGRKVLVTGATGFMGKALIEKLLRSTGVAVIYMLVRPKKGKTVDQRVADYFNNAIFSQLDKNEHRSRVRAVEGDVSLPGLGLSSSDLLLLQEEVEILFHGAATVRFDETLQRAVHINIRGTREMLQLAHTFARLKAFVHLSTAYSNCLHMEIKEEFYDPPMTGDNAINLVEILSDAQLTHTTDTICGEYPNTYAFTKAVAENVVKVHGQGLPLIVFRPAIVIATANEPIKGWVDNVLIGPMGIICAVGAGVFRVMRADLNCVAEVVPVDMTVNAVIASAWKIGQDRKREDMPVYNYVSSCQNPLLWKQFMDISLGYGRKWPTVNALWYYTLTTTKSRTMFILYQWLLHLIPGFLVDSVLQLSGQNTRLLRVYKKIYKYSDIVAYFSVRQWQFHNDRVLELWRSMSDRDRQQFNFDISSLDWNKFFEDSTWALRESFFNDTPDTIPAGKRKQFCFWVIHNTLKCLLLAGVAGMLWKASILVSLVAAY